ncbi:hypothetical protein L1987_53498 [Smallanthus sonchifolius]|uniref:Uncharacterized protein n=1 Tax=Smallanthus sonchifolius TaxID=185202 RepID=A0ACB9EVU3_9ASTR|nr:hypothetical protein L1987_53498 [Smallanthus sonchifolius]
MGGSLSSKTRKGNVNGYRFCYMEYHALEHVENLVKPGLLQELHKFEPNDSLGYNTRKQMKWLGVDKDPGSSRTDIGDQVHEFGGELHHPSRKLLDSRGVSQGTKRSWPKVVHPTKTLQI